MFYLYVAKTKALISFTVTAKLICVFVFAYAKCRVSHDGTTRVKPCCVLEQGTFTPQKVLVIPRKQWLRPNMTEKSFTGTLRINQPTNQLMMESNNHVSAKSWKNRNTSHLGHDSCGPDAMNKLSFPLPTRNLALIGQAVLEKKMFEQCRRTTTDRGMPDRWTDTGSRIYYTLNW